MNLRFVRSAAFAPALQATSVPQRWVSWRPLLLMALMLYLWSSLPASGAAPALVPVPDLGLRVAAGFRVTLFADNDLAPDVYAMTLDSRGRPVVTSRGYVRVLHDNNRDGRADQATTFAQTTTGGMGLCFDGNDLYFVGDGFLGVYHDTNGDGVADGAAEKLVVLAGGEHGGHAVRKGPDGAWYVIGGNDTRFSATNHVTNPASPVRSPEAGALLRVTPQGNEIIAHGFRNPYDFDFNAMGDIFTFDSDVESDLFLPWYTPTRVYHVGHGAHHGWRLPGHTRSWNRPDHYFDTVPILFGVGRGSPTSVVCYRHKRFPERFRNGLFILDWTFGKVYFCGVGVDGAGYRVEPEVFLESVGTQGFTPTDAAVAPDGSLYLSVGGRKTRGGVYRIEYTGTDVSTPEPDPSLAERLALELLLDAPQPLEAWSRTLWVPAAQRLGPERIGAGLFDLELRPELRVRAVEILTELFQGLSTREARVAARDLNPAVRARVAWSLGRAPCADYATILPPMAMDVHPNVRRFALQSLAERAADLHATNLLPVLPLNLAHGDARVRRAAALLATRLPEAAWNKLSVALLKAAPQARLTHALAGVWRNPEFALHTNALETALATLNTSRDPDLRLDAVRLIMLALGDHKIDDPSLEVYSAYELRLPLQGRDGMVTRILNAVRPAFGSNQSYLDAEVARLLGMLNDADTNSLRHVLGRITPASYPGVDVHYLTVLSRLRAPRDSEATTRTAHALLTLDRKLAGQQLRPLQNWRLRLAEVTHELLERDPALARALLAHADFARPNHAGLVTLLNPKDREAAARLFVAMVRNNPGVVWPAPLLDVLTTLPHAEIAPLLRQQWSNAAFRDAILTQLAKQPDAQDRERFLTGLTASPMPVARLCFNALEKLPRDNAPDRVVPLFQFLGRLLADPKQRPLRTNAIALISRQTGQKLTVEETDADVGDLRKVYQPYFDWFGTKHPNLRSAVSLDPVDDDANWNQMLKTVVWASGRAAAGAQVFSERGCQACHASSSPLGPDLAGVANRLSADDLFRSIIYPSRDIAPLHRATTFRLQNRQEFTGAVVFESADGVIVQTGAATTVRLAHEDIVARSTATTSLMPAGLLNGLNAAQLADLYAYLRTLQPRPQ